MPKTIAPFNPDDMLMAMRAASLAPYRDVLNLTPDGRIQRFRVEGDKAGSRNGWAVAHADPMPHGAFGSWKTGVQHTWRKASRDPLTPAQHAIMHGQFEAMRRARDAAQAGAYADAARRAAELWNKAGAADPFHAYLVKKLVSPIGLRQLRDRLVVPVRDVDGRLTSLQFIDGGGRKRFLSGGRLKAAYFSIGRVRGDVLLLCEGVATALTLHMATGRPTAASFSAGNLEPVARALKRNMPSVRILVCGDDDPVGRREAQRAAAAVDGATMFPVFSKGCA